MVAKINGTNKSILNLEELNFNLKMEHIVFYLNNAKRF